MVYTGTFGQFTLICFIKIICAGITTCITIVVPAFSANIGLFTKVVYREHDGLALDAFIHAKKKKAAHNTAFMTIVLPWNVMLST